MAPPAAIFHAVSILRTRVVVKGKCHKRLESGGDKKNKSGNLFDLLDWKLFH